MGEPRVTWTRRLAPEQVTACLAVVGAAREADGVAPLSEHVELHLGGGGDPDSTHLLVHLDGVLAGYGHLDLTDEVEGPSAELVVDPRLRRRGLGRVVLDALLERSGGRLRVWAHGALPGADRLARESGFSSWRVLLQLGRDLASTELPDATFGDDITVRTFVPARDEAAWVAVNAAAFVDLPDQGSWGLEDLRRREAEPWFDPAGFFLAEDAAGALLGFHWTKVHGGTGGHLPDGPPDHDHEPIGEVYVVGVHPGAQGRGLGPALTALGLHHLRSRGLRRVMLYVDETNTGALRVYQALGFREWSHDVCYRRR